MWQGALDGGQPSTSSYGTLLAPDSNGIELPAGFASRVVARTAERVGTTSHRWHGNPDGGACFPDGAGWIYVSNSEVSDTGGTGAIRFRPDGTIGDAYSIVSGTDRNCAGGPTPWLRWLSCEEVTRGQVYEADPFGRLPAVARPAMGRFRHEAAAVDPPRRVVYLTEDEPDGCFYRFRPSAWPDLATGALEVLLRGADVRAARWAVVPDPSGAEIPTRYQVRQAQPFGGGEGAWYADDSCWFTTKDDNRIWRYDAGQSRLSIVYADSVGSQPLAGVDNITASGDGELFVAEDSSRMALCLITAGGGVSRFLRFVGHEGSEVTGPAFTPDGSRLYLSSQRGTAGEGVTYEISGPFHGRTAA